MQMLSVSGIGKDREEKRKPEQGGVALGGLLKAQSRFARNLGLILRAEVVQVALRLAAVSNAAIFQREPS